MSHNIMYDTYPENVDKGRVQKSWDNYVAIADRGEGASGLPGQIRWLSTVCDSEDEAHDYIRSVDSGNYDQIAVRFRRAAAPSAKLSELRKKLQEAETAFHTMDFDVHYSHTTTKFVGCKKCGSSLAREYLDTNFCPMCHNDLRPQSTRDRIAKAREKADKLRQQVREEEKKNNKKGKLFWLVKVEYHT